MYFEQWASKKYNININILYNNIDDKSMVFTFKDLKDAFNAGQVYSIPKCDHSYEYISNTGFIGTKCIKCGHILYQQVIR